MPTFPTNPALEAAVIEAADDDAPRLVYADWLEEHGDDDRAEFIRVQCRLADISPTEPEWIDLTERQEELASRLKPRFRELEPPEPKRFYFGLDIIGKHEEPFRRGFPYFHKCHMTGAQWTPKSTARVAADLDRLVETSTVRGLLLSSIPGDRFADLLAAPALAELSGVSFRVERTTDAAYRMLATSPAVCRVRHLGMYGFVPPEGVVALAKAKSLDAVRRLTIQYLSAPPNDLASLTASGWFRQVRHLRVHLRESEVAGPMVAGIGQLPDLHTLDLPELAEAVPELTRGPFPSLARVHYHGPLDCASATTLASAKYPNLIAFTASSQQMKNDAFFELLRADWFDRLRILDLASNAIRGRAIATLAAHPVAKRLRVLRLGDNPLGKGGLKAITRSGAFPEVTTLDLHSSIKQKATAADMLSFVSALQLPRLRHLDLRGWPLGDDGAQALAASPAFAGLTRLDLSDCEIGDIGAKALFDSPHLQKLVYLGLGSNFIMTAADALADPGVMPRLSECWLHSNTISATSAAKIKGSGRWVLV